MLLVNFCFCLLIFSVFVEIKQNGRYRVKEIGVRQTVKEGLLWLEKYHITNLLFLISVVSLLWREYAKYVNKILLVVFLLGIIIMPIVFSAFSLLYEPYFRKSLSPSVEAFIFWIVLSKALKHFGLVNDECLSLVSAEIITLLLMLMVIDMMLFNPNVEKKLNLSKNCSH